MTSEEPKDRNKMEEAPVPAPMIFENVLEESITFCVDTSGSMYNCLHIVKEQLVEALYKHVKHPSGSPLFNIVEFNSQVTQWSDKMVKCTPETVAVASKWIDELSAKTGTNTLDALLTALGDTECKAVYLVTDGLPDQNPEEILDHVGYVSNDRPIHCVYLMDEKADESATEFLEDLAIETYGSFFIASITTKGAIEKITPVFKAENSNYLKSTDNNLFSKMKQCNVSTTLAADPIENAYLNSRLVSSVINPYVFPPVQGYHYYNPSYWSRYRPAKGWLKMQDKLLDEAQALELSPAAGALLIGKQVLARRNEDGYFYSGSVQSQIYENKFLVAFGPCKHGKYKDTTYQETMVHDILDYVDAKRRTVVTGDKVLSSWEPEGDKFGPGVVIDGFEKREAEGPDDKGITVAFSNGKTEKVAPDTAVWIPEPMYDRLNVELKMPRSTREKLASQPNYPSENLPGYPTSGPIAYPQKYPKPASLVLESEVPLNSFHRYPPYGPVYPIYLKRSEPKKHKTVVKREDVHALIPGTQLTTKELEDRVTSQLMEHKLFLDERENEKNGRLLNRRGNRSVNGLRKSVSFNDENLVQMSATPRDHSPMNVGSGRTYGFYKDGQFIPDRSQGSDNRRYGHMNKDGNFIPDRSEGGKMYGFMDENGKFQSERSQNDRNYGYVDKDGKFVPDHDGTGGRKYGYLDKEGHFTSDIDSPLGNMEGQTYGYFDTNGFFTPEDKKQNYGYMDRDGKFVPDRSRNQNYGYIDHDGKFVPDNSQGLNCGYIDRDGKFVPDRSRGQNYGYIDRDGKFVPDRSQGQNYGYIDRDGKFIPDRSQNQVYGHIDRDGKFVPDRSENQMYGYMDNKGKFVQDESQGVYGYFDSNGQFVPERDESGFSIGPDGKPLYDIHGRDGYPSIDSSDKYNQSEYRDMKFKCRDPNLSDTDRDFWKSTYNKELKDLKSRCTDPHIPEELRERMKQKYDDELMDLKYRCRDPNLSDTDRELWRSTYNNELNDLKQKSSDPNLSKGQRELWKVKFDQEMRDMKERCRDPNLSETDRAFWKEAYNNEMRDIEYRGRDQTLPAKERSYWRDVYDYEVRDLEYRCIDPDLSDKERNSWKNLFEYIGSSRNIGVNTDSSLLFFRRPSSADSAMKTRPPWKYWNADPSPVLYDTDTQLREMGLYEGYRETALEAPLEVRTSSNPYIVEWKNPQFQFVDPFAKHNYNQTMNSVLQPKPPTLKNGFSKSVNFKDEGLERLANGFSKSVNIQTDVPRNPSKDEIADARREYRRQKIMQRHLEWQGKVAEEHNMKELMQDQHRQRIIEQLNHERERQVNDHKMIEKQREAKKNISAEIRARIETNQQHEQSKEEQRIAAIARNREHREALQAQRQSELKNLVERRKIVREQQSQQRAETISRKLDEQEAQKMILDTKQRNAKIRRMHHFQQLETNAQHQKELNAAVKEQQKGIQLSQIFS